MSRILENAKNQVTNGYSHSHQGIDVVKEQSQLANIIAHSDGKVVWIQTGMKNAKGSSGNASYGNCVKIQHSNGYYTLYAHLNRVDVVQGQEVEQGQIIGYMGDSGNAYGAHLHFEVRNEQDVRIDPTNYIEADLPIQKMESKNENIEYRVHTKGGSWLPWVNKADDTANGYAGIYGQPIDGIQVRNRTYRAHTLNEKWWDEVSKVDDTANGYAGVFGRSIDGIKVKNAQYRVHVMAKGNLKAEWLPWVNKADDTANGYAGYVGREIDGIQIKSL